MLGSIMKILVTGATGVIGRRLIRRLHEAGHEVTAAVRSRARAAELMRQGAAIVTLDLFDRRQVERAIAGHDVVVNLATRIPKLSRIFLPWAWRETDRLRTLASAVLVDAALESGVSRFVQESFAPVYPDRGEQWIDESTPIRPARYNRTVVDAERSAERFTQAGRTGVVVRFGAFYGADADQTIELMRFVRRGWAPLPGPASAYISSVSHDDAAAAVAAAVTLPAGAYNVVDDEPVTHRVFVDSLAHALGLRSPKLPPAWLTPLFGSVGEMAARSLRISNRKLRSASGWKPRFSSVREGWIELVAQLKAHHSAAA